jgi:hypothetical protein
MQSVGCFAVAPDVTSSSLERNRSLEPTSPPPAPAPASSDVDPLESLHDRFAPQLEAVSEHLLDANERAKAFIRENPGTALLGAAALGFVIGKWASRR